MYGTTKTSFHLPFSPINSSPSPTVSSPSRSIPQKGPVPNIHEVTRVIYIGLETLTSAAAMVVSSAFVSYAGATSTISAETMCNPSRPRKMVRNSRVDHPPVSGVPVAGANAGSIESICIRQAESACSTGKQRTYVDGEIDWLVANRLTDLLDDPRRTCVRK